MPSAACDIPRQRGAAGETSGSDEWDIRSDRWVARGRECRGSRAPGRPRSRRLGNPGASPQVRIGPIAALNARPRVFRFRAPQLDGQLHDFIEAGLDVNAGPGTLVVLILSARRPRGWHDGWHGARRAAAESRTGHEDRRLRAGHDRELREHPGERFPSGSVRPMRSTSAISRVSPPSSLSARIRSQAS